MGTPSTFRKLTQAGGRLGFYMSDQARDVPEHPGCYAWMLPLWLYRNDLGDFLSLASNVLNYESASKVCSNIPFSWEDIELVAHRHPRAKHTEAKAKTWKAVLQDGEAPAFLKETLLEASLFMRPLYVGKTDNLRRRYLEHVEGKDQWSNVFHARLSECARALNLKLRVVDLLFVSLKTPGIPQSLRDKVSDDEYNLLIEQVMMQLCQPPFSVR